MKIRPATCTDEAAVTALWRRCELVVSHNDPVHDFHFALGKPNSDVLVAEDPDIIGSVMVGHDGHRGWLYYVSVDRARRKQGVGRALVKSAEMWFAAHGITKAQLMVRDTNTAVVAFYERLGFESQPRITMAKWLKP
jgi:ribosomal protein S18 acetylase RimI-like enzyme